MSPGHIMNKTSTWLWTDQLLQYQFHTLAVQCEGLHPISESQKFRGGQYGCWWWWGGWHVQLEYVFIRSQTKGTKILKNPWVGFHSEASTVWINAWVYNDMVSGGAHLGGAKWMALKCICQMYLPRDALLSHSSWYRINSKPVVSTKQCSGWIQSLVTKSMFVIFKSECKHINIFWCKEQTNCKNVFFFIIASSLRWRWSWWERAAIYLYKNIRVKPQVNLSVCLYAKNERLLFKKGRSC